MNALTGKKVIFVYSSGDIQSLVAAAVAYEANRAGVTLVDINGLIAQDINAALAAADADKHYVFCLAPTSAEGDTGILSYAQVSYCLSLLVEDNIPEPVEEAAAQDGSTETTIKLATTASATNDFYNGMIVKVGTQYRRITDYVGTTKVATIAGEWTDIPLEEEDYIIYPVRATYMHDSRMNGVLGREFSYYAWEVIRPGIQPPPVINTLGNYKKWIDFGTMQALSKLQATKEVGATIAAANRVRNDYLNGMHFFIVGGKGIGYSGRITDHVGSTLVVTLSPSVSVDNTTVYRITENERDVLSDLRLRYAITTYLSDLTDGMTMRNWGLLLNKDSALDNGSKVALFDDVYYWNLIETIGKSIVDYTVL